ncbi:MAG: translocation/assembly module TamB domain-containing protein [Roseicyclus sp.]
MRRGLAILSVVASLLVPGLATAQDDGDQSRIVRFLQDQLSDGARQITIRGFRGALSSTAQMDLLTIADSEGVWLTLENAQLEWSRAALLRGALQINQLTAERIELARAPVAEPGRIDLPQAEATPFALPDLPVSIQIDRVAIETVQLGAPILGTAVDLSLAGSASLAGGSGAADLEIQRLDGPRGVFDLNASFDNATEALIVSLLLDEDPGGLAATLLNLPDAPALRLTVDGAGPINAFTADIALSSAGADRLSGQIVTLRDAETQDRRIRLDLSGDITPLLAAEYRDFFGNAVGLTADMLLLASGEINFESLNVKSAELSLGGSLVLAPGGRPQAFDLIGRIADDTGGDPVRLPVPGANLMVQSVDLAIRHDVAEGPEYETTFVIDGLETDTIGISRAELSAGGLFEQSADNGMAISSPVSIQLSGLTHTDPALSQALGDALRATAQVSWVSDAPLFLTGLTVSAGDLDLTGNAAARFGENRLLVNSDLRADTPDLGRFAAAAGQPLGGALSAALVAEIDLLSGAFDVVLDGEGSDLRLAEATPPDLLAGLTTLRLSALRDADGLTLRELVLRSQQLQLDANGRYGIGGTSVVARGRLADAGLFTSTVSGAVDAEITMDRPAGDDAPFQIEADVSAEAGITATLAGAYNVDTGAADITASGRLEDIGLFTDAVRGAVSADATISRTGLTAPLMIDANATGAGGITARISGQYDPAEAVADLRAAGQLPLGLANRALQPRSISGTLAFDLGLTGAPTLENLSGTFSTSGARVSLPFLQNAIENLGVSGRLTGGRVGFDANGTLGSGGQIGAAGTVTVSAPSLPAQITVTGRGLRLVDPTLYNVLVDTADISVSGALAGAMQVSGSVNLGESELRVPESGLGGSTVIPDIRHIGETAPELRTRAAAGLVQTDTGPAGSSNIGLDLTISAPGRIFIRGRGLDAEMGGTLRLGGTSANIIPSGRFDLIRGRLSILGTRLDLTDGSATLQGNFDPFVRLLATSRAGGHTIGINVIGVISNPAISFTSDPPLPEDEVLAQLLFGRSVSALSPVQLLQMADAAASLAGGSTESGIFASLREGLGLDDLDFQTDEAGNAAVRAGRYLSDNIYADVTVGSEETDLSLNIDLTPNITARGAFSSDGSSSLGVFYERDY